MSHLLSISILFLPLVDGSNHNLPAIFHFSQRAPKLAVDLNFLLVFLTSPLRTLEIVAASDQLQCTSINIRLPVISIISNSGNRTYIKYFKKIYHKKELL